MKYYISRPPLFAFMCEAFFAFSFAFPPVVWAKDPYAQPAGISPTSARLDEVIAFCVAASPSPRQQAPDAGSKARLNS